MRNWECRNQKCFYMFYNGVYYKEQQGKGRCKRKSDCTPATYRKKGQNNLNKSEQTGGQCVANSSSLKMRCKNERCVTRAIYGRIGKETTTNTTCKDLKHCLDLVCFGSHELKESIFAELPSLKTKYKKNWGCRNHHQYNMQGFKALP